MFDVFVFTSLRIPYPRLVTTLSFCFIKKQKNCGTCFKNYVKRTWQCRQGVIRVVIIISNWIPGQFPLFENDTKFRMWRNFNLGWNTCFLKEAITRRMENMQNDSGIRRHCFGASVCCAVYSRSTFVFLVRCIKFTNVEIQQKKKNCNRFPWKSSERNACF